MYTTIYQLYIKYNGFKANKNSRNMVNQYDEGQALINIWQHNYCNKPPGQKQKACLWAMTYRKYAFKTEGMVLGDICQAGRGKEKELGYTGGTVGFNIF